MPTPDRTSLEEIVRAASDLLEVDGADGLSMRAVADRVGVRPPSLYKRVRDRDDLLRLVAESAVAQLATRLDAVAAAAQGDPRARLADLAGALRAFALERPAAYRLLFAPASPASRLAPETFAPATAALFAVVAELAGDDDALEAARTVTAWATGFIGMELAGAFRLGGDVDRAFAFGVARLGSALARPAAD